MLSARFCTDENKYLQTSQQTETKPAHTPTIAPIQAVAEYLLNAKGERIGELFGSMDERVSAARQIVRAVNSHAELCEKLEQFVRYTNNTTDSALALFNREARAALAKAKA